MTQMRLDADLWKRLDGCKEPIQLIDENGKVVARVIPEPAAKPSPPPYEPPNWTPEEFQKILEQPGYTTEELLDRLEKL